MSQHSRQVHTSTPFLENLINHFLPKAIEGDPGAQFELAEVWYFVVGLPDVAFSWYKRAALSRHGKAAFRLSRMYLSGSGVEEDPVMAMRWVQLS